MPISSVRDDNRVPAIFGVSSVDLKTPTPIKVNPLTGGMLIDSTSIYTGLDTRYLQLTGGTMTGTDVKITFPGSVGNGGGIFFGGSASITQIGSGKINITSGLAIQNWLFLGDSGAPANTTSGDLTFIRGFASGSVTVGSLRIDQTPTAGAVTPTHTFTISLNGTTYRIPCLV